MPDGRNDPSGAEDVHLGPKIMQQKGAILINLNKQYVAHLMVLSFSFVKAAWDEGL